MDFSTVAEGTLLWEPSEELKREANIARYIEFLRKEKKLHFETYDDLWKWSVTNLEEFW
jgi:acetoacetyl-CoA synthetase